MIDEIINRLYEYLAVEILGSPLLFGIMILALAVLLLIAIGLPRWAILSYSTPMAVALSSPFYHPILMPEWIFYIILIFLGILWGLMIIKIKGG